MANPNTFTLTITGKAGAGASFTSSQITNVTGFSYDNTALTLTVFRSSGEPLIIAFAGGTWTVTCSGGIISAMSMTA